MDAELQRLRWRLPPRWGRTCLCGGDDEAFPINTRKAIPRETGCLRHRLAGNGEPVEVIIVETEQGPRGAGERDEGSLVYPPRFSSGSFSSFFLHPIRFLPPCPHYYTSPHFLPFYSPPILAVHPRVVAQGRAKRGTIAQRQGVLRKIGERRVGIPN